MAERVQRVRPTVRELSTVVVALVLLLGLAFVAASLTKDAQIFSLSPPDSDTADISEDQKLDLYRTFYTAWAALILVTPALCTFLYRRTSQLAARYWLAFWSASLVVFLVHFYWAVVIIFDAKWERILETTRVSQPWPDALLALWWVVDVIIAWTLPTERLWIRIERALVHLLAFILFFAGSALEGEILASRVLGVLLALGVLIAVVDWLIVQWTNRTTRTEHVI